MDKAGLHHLFGQLLFVELLRPRRGMRGTLLFHTKHKGEGHFFNENQNLSVLRADENLEPALFQRFCDRRFPFAEFRRCRRRRRLRLFTENRQNFLNSVVRGLRAVRAAEVKSI